MARAVRVSDSGLLGTAVAVTVVAVSLVVSVYHVLAHTAPLVPTVLGQGLLLVTSLAFALLAFALLSNAGTATERDIMGLRAGGGYVVAGVASGAYAVHQVLTPEAVVAADVVLFETTFVATAGGIAGLLLGREAAQHKRTIADLGETTAELERSRQRIEAERERFRSLFQNAPSMIVDVRHDDGTLRVEAANGAFADVAGEEPSAVTGTELFETVSHRDPDARERLVDALTAGERLETEVTVDERGEEYYKLRLVPYGDGGRAFVIYTDVTDLREAKQELERRYELANEELKRRNEQLERSNEQLNQFAYVASHDLQEPLRMVGSYVDLLADEYEGELSEEADQYIEYAVDGAERMQDMINGLLEFSRVSTNAGRITETDAEAVFERTRRDLQPLISERDAEVTCGDLPTVAADETQLGQLFQNLVKNAIEHGGCDGASPEVHVDATERDDSHVFRVADNGPGIPEDEQEQVFEIFEQRHRSTEGTGIGLAICQRIVDRHGGDIWVESTDGEGSEFYFTMSKPEASGPDPASAHPDADPP